MNNNSELTKEKFLKDLEDVYSPRQVEEKKLLYSRKMYETYSIEQLLSFLYIGKINTFVPKELLNKASSSSDGYIETYYGIRFYIVTNIKI